MTWAGAYGGGVDETIAIAGGHGLTIGAEGPWPTRRCRVQHGAPRRRGRALEVFRWVDRMPGMPIYEFHCEKCGKDSEVLVRSADWQGTPCPQCGSTKLA